jgi:GT2 family glycosyltransferase
MEPFFSVLMVNFNGLEHLPACLESLERQSFQAFEVILVDNASSDASVLWVQEHFPRVRVVESAKNLGFAGGNNLGLSFCKAPYVFLLNNDTVLFEDCLEKLKEAVDEVPQVSVLQALMLDFNDSAKVDSWGDALYWWGTSYNGRGEAVRDLEVMPAVIPIASACGGASVWPVDLLVSLGAFDESYFLLFEDVDLSMRARHQGASIFLVKEAKLLHKGSASIGKHSSLNVFYSARNLIWTRFKNFPALTLLKSLPFLCLYQTMMFFRAIYKGRFWVWLKAQFAALWGLNTIWKKRKEILSASKISRLEFESWLRKGAIQEKWMAYKKSKLKV